MRILSVTAQKPCSTGSGVYLTEVVKALAKEGHTQNVLAGIARGEQMDMPDGVKTYPVYFESEGLPYPVVGMSDEMPYISTKYKDMTEEMTVQFRNAFLAVLDEVIEREDPELILCHHLYYLTALSGKESIWILSQYGFETDEKYVISTGIYTQSDSAS